MNGPSKKFWEAEKAKFIADLDEFGYKVSKDDITLIDEATHAMVELVDSVKGKNLEMVVEKNWGLMCEEIYEEVEIPENYTFHFKVKAKFILNEEYVLPTSVHVRKDGIGIDIEEVDYWSTELPYEDDEEIPFENMKLGKEFLTKILTTEEITR